MELTQEEIIKFKELLESQDKDKDKDKTKSEEDGAGDSGETPPTDVTNYQEEFSKLTLEHEKLKASYNEVSKLIKKFNEKQVDTTTIRKNPNYKSILK